MQACLLALDDTGVAREEAFALERGAQLRISLDERPSTPATRRGAVAMVRRAWRGKYSSIVRPLTHVAPSPGLRITRATEVLRLPVPRY